MYTDYTFNFKINEKLNDLIHAEHTEQQKLVVSIYCKEGRCTHALMQSAMSPFMHIRYIVDV